MGLTENSPAFLFSVSSQPDIFFLSQIFFWQFPLVNFWLLEIHLKLVASGLLTKGQHNIDYKLGVPGKQVWAIVKRFNVTPQ